MGGGVSLCGMKSQILDQVSGAISNAGKSFLDAMMPPRCPISGTPVSDAGQLGPQAWSSLHFIDTPFCPSCGVPYAADYGAHVECPSCIASPPIFDRARAALVYDEFSHKLVVGFKHGDRTELAPIFAKWLAGAGSPLLTHQPILLPVPLHKRRLLARRYNQSAILAQYISILTGARFDDRLLRRMRATPPQKNLSAGARQRNVAGAFAVPKNVEADVVRAHIVLIDDVLTTGATISACAKALKTAGAAQVDALVLARVVKGGIGAI